VNAYLDSSVILRIILKQPGPFERWREFEALIGSHLVEVECLRTLDRLRAAEGLPEDVFLAYRADLFEILKGMDLFQPTPPILRRASDAFPIAIGTLDAIHLATALAWRDERSDDLVFATHDKALGKAAGALGLQTEGF
jgi:predicted nucleic acid-binding protein